MFGRKKKQKTLPAPSRNTPLTGHYVPVYGTEFTSITHLDETLGKEVCLLARLVPSKEMFEILQIEKDSSGAERHSLLAPSVSFAQAMDMIRKHEAPILEGQHGITITKTAEDIGNAHYLNFLHRENFVLNEEGEIWMVENGKPLGYGKFSAETLAIAAQMPLVQNTAPVDRFFGGLNTERAEKIDIPQIINTFSAQGIAIQEIDGFVAELEKRVNEIEQLMPRLQNAIQKRRFHGVKVSTKTVSSEYYDRQYQVLALNSEHNMCYALHQLQKTLEGLRRLSNNGSFGATVAPLASMAQIVTSMLKAYGLNTALVLNKHDEIVWESHLDNLGKPIKNQGPVFKDRNDVTTQARDIIMKQIPFFAIEAGYSETQAKRIAALAVEIDKPFPADLPENVVSYAKELLVRMQEVQTRVHAGELVRAEDKQATPMGDKITATLGTGPR